MSENYGVSEAAKALAEYNYGKLRDRAVSELEAHPELKESFGVPATWDELGTANQHPYLSRHLPEVMVVYPAISQAVEDHARTETIVKVNSPATKQAVIDLLPDTVPNKDFLAEAILSQLTDTLTA